MNSLVEFELVGLEVCGRYVRCLVIIVISTKLGVAEI